MSTLTLTKDAKSHQKIANISNTYNAAAMTEFDDRKLIWKAYRDLLGTFKNSLNPKDSLDIRDAFEWAVKMHEAQRRKTGEPYILHPIAVAQICVEEIGLGPTAVVCALLHDVVEDTPATSKQIADRFGDRVALIVDGLTKLDGLHDSESPQAENLTKVLRTMITDVRVVLIKMADRLHNLRTIKGMPHHKQLKIAAETTFIYAPLAHRLGLYEFKNEFQDICLKITNPEEYHAIANKLNETKRARERYIKDFMEPLQQELDDIGFSVEIIGRPKSIYSIWNKIRSKNVPFEEIYDLFAIRIIADVDGSNRTLERSACWQIYTIVSIHFQPLVERLKDWITHPKANGYESLHTTVVGPDGRFVEIQIRTKRMDEIAEKGFAAHWKYKGIAKVAGKSITATSKKANTREVGDNNSDDEPLENRPKAKQDRDVFETWLDNVREAIENADGSSPVEFLNDFQNALFTSEVHVFTPKGELKILPEGATALDFAFSIHSDLGCKCQSVKVNNRLVSIFEKIHNGDQIEIITNKAQKPRESWLQHVVTTKAITRIRVALREEVKMEADYGKEILHRKLNAMKAHLEENVDMLARFYQFPNRADFLSAIHKEQIDLSLLKTFKVEAGLLTESEEPKKKTEHVPAKPNKLFTASASDIIINNESGKRYQHSLATCCNPVHGDGIFAFLKGNQGAVIHRAACPNATNLLAQYAHRVLKAEWGNTVKSEFTADILVTGQDSGVGVISSLLEKISNELGINIRSMSISGIGGKFEGRISLVVQNADQLNLAIRVLKNVSGVANVNRLET